MHVLQVAWEFPPRLFGGLGRHVDGLSRGLAAAGIDVTVLTPAVPGLEPTPPQGIRVLRAGAPPFPRPHVDWLAATLDHNASMARAGLRADLRADIVHAHDWMAAHAARVLATALGVGLVATIHATERGRHQGHLPPGYSAWIDAQERELVAAADWVVVCAEHMAGHVCTQLAATAERLSVIAGGVTVEQWQGPASVTPTARPTVVFAGRLEYEKGVHVLLAATAALDCDVVVAGQGTHEAQLRQQAHRGVRFTGHLDQPDLATLLRSATVVVVPSLYEPFGLAAIEAMAAGTPVIASDTGGLAATVTANSGLLVPPGDTAALARAICAVLADPALASRLADGGVKRVRQLSWTRAAHHHVEVYDAVVSARSPKASSARTIPNPSAATTTTTTA